MAKRRKGRSLSGSIRQYLTEHPEWLSSSDTKEIVDQYKADHPGKSVNSKVMQAIYNMKSLMRKGEAGVAKRKQSKATAQRIIQSAAASGKRMAPLAMLEEQIDDCMILAKHIGKDTMMDVLTNLHRARNAVVVMLQT